MNEETEETVVLFRKEIMRLKNIIKNSSGHIKRQSSLFLPMNYIIDDVSFDRNINNVEFIHEGYSITLAKYYLEQIT